MKYPNSQRMELLDTMEALHRTVMNADPRHCYDELCKLHSKYVVFMRIRLICLVLYSISSMSRTAQSFNDLIRQSSGLGRLKSDKFIVLDSTKQEIKQKIEKLNQSIHEPIPKLGDLINNQSMFVHERITKKKHFHSFF